MGKVMRIKQCEKNTEEINRTGYAYYKLMYGGKTRN